MTQNLNVNKPLALIIEDEEYLADIFSKALETVGYTTEIILDGAEALERLTNAMPAIIVLTLLKQ